MINIADFFADIYGTKCNISKIGEIWSLNHPYSFKSQDGAFFTNKTAQLDLGVPSPHTGLT
jgi:hypothetical protein